MLITECVTAQPKARIPWVKILVDIGSWAASQNLFTQWLDLFLVFLSTNLVMWFDVSVPAHIISCETQAACLMVHGNIGESGFTSKDAICL